MGFLQIGDETCTLSVILKPEEEISYYKQKPGERENSRNKPPKIDAEILLKDAEVAI